MYIIDKTVNLRYLLERKLRCQLSQVGHNYNMSVYGNSGKLKTFSWFKYLSILLMVKNIINNICGLYKLSSDVKTWPGIIFL